MQMAIKSVQFKLNGQTYNLTYDSSAGAYKATITAPSITSYNANDDHKFHGEVIAADNAGNVASATVSQFPALGLRVLEKVKPSQSMTYPAASAVIGTNLPTIKWNVTDADSGIDPDTIGISIDGGAVIKSDITKTAITNGYTCQYTPTSALNDGAHTLSFTVSDHDGNAATALTSSFTVDTVPPVLNVTAPVDDYVTNNTTLTVTGTSNDATSGPVTVTVNGKAATVNADGSFSVEVALTEGTNSITVVSADSAGKSTTVTRTVTLDTAAPVIANVTLTPNPVDAGQTYIVTVEVTD